MALFRNGDSSGDTIAKKLHQLWLNGKIKVNDYEFTFRDVRVCQPEKFKAMACLLATKPCDHRHAQIQVCRFVLLPLNIFVCAMMFLL